jgi:hypothetical protein
MAVTSVVNRNAQASTTPPPGAQKAADQFSKLAQQATRSGEAANATGSDAKNTAVKTDQSKVQGRGERDQDQGGQNHSGKQIRLVNGVRVTTTDGHVTGRVNIRSNNETNVTAGPQNTAMNTPEMKQATSAELRNPSQALPAAGPTAGPTAGSVVLTMPRLPEARSTRPGETSGKVSNDFASSGTTSSLIAEAAIRDQPDSGGSSDGGSGDQGGDTSGGNNSGEDLGSGDLGAGGIDGGGSGLPPGGRTSVAGAAPEEPEEPDEVDGVNDLGGVSEETRLQTTAEWRVTDPYFGLYPEEDDSISSLLAGIELSQRSEDQDVRDDQRSFIAMMRVPLKLFASYIISPGKDGPERNPPACGLTILRTPVAANFDTAKLSPEETAELIEALLASKIASSDRERLILNSIDFILNYAFTLLRSFYKSEDDLREAFALTTRHDIVDHIWDPSHHVFTLAALAENQLYQASSVELIRSPERDKVMDYFVSSADDPSRKANIIAVIMATGLPADEAMRKLDSGDATLAQQLERFLLTGQWRFRTPFANDEQNAAITSRFVDLELSQPNCNFEIVPRQMFDMANIPLRNRLKELADFLVTGESLTNHGIKMPAQLSVDESSDIIETLVESKNNIVRPEVILSNSAEFIKRYRYSGDSDKVSADYREAFALATRYNIERPISSAVTLLSQNNQDLLSSDSRDAVMAYFVSSSDDDSRKAAVANIMMTRSVSAGEAARDLDLG